MVTIKDFSASNIQQIVDQLESEKELSYTLPGNGQMHIEPGFPYLIIYRKKKNDKGTHRLVSSGASYLVIGNKDFKGYQKMILAIAGKLSVKFKSYMLFEFYAGNRDSKTFRIKGPAKRLPSTLDTLKKELDEINSSFSGLYLSAEIQDTFHRQNEEHLQLLPIEDLKNTGALLVGLEIPPVYRNDEGKLYPVFFRNYKDFIIKAVQKAIYEFIRIQTTNGVASFRALGRKHLKDKVFEIDRKLCEIEKSYQFLWLVSPANIYDIKQEFFKSNYKNVLDYHYRLLPIDPDILKRRLYNLKIEEIDDPAMSYIFHEKREELDQQITMLNERGSKKFFYNSIRLYKGIENELCEEAHHILAEVPEQESKKGDNILSSEDFASLARKEFEYFKQQDPGFYCKVHVRKDVNVMMVSHGELYIPAEYWMNETEARALIQHEVGTHVLTYYNGKKQPLSQLSVGLADYDPLQEGIAVLSEYLVGGLTANRLRILAGRVLAGKALIEGADFQEIFALLYTQKGFSAERAFNITSRIMQGGGFIKDIIYLKGLVQLRAYLQDKGELEPLLAGKYNLKHKEVIQELTARKVLNAPLLRPSYLNSKNFKERLQLIRDGLPISKMINS
tara:strand:+ start:1580 stop:3430 length:1851 start_codon:yes stop_codon:yes gene_type:complete